MNLGKLERFAQMARRELHKQIKARLEVVLQLQSLERRDQPAVVRQLDQEISETSRDKVVARVAYTWFNRFCALRFMDVNGYNRVRVVSPSEGFIQPELLTEAKQGMLPEEWFTENPPALERVRGLLEGRTSSPSPEQEAYALLLVAACNSLHKAMPYLFEAINDVTELLLPADLLSPNSVLTYVRDTLDTESCVSVEVIGWLYQFYISEKKREVFDGMKKNQKVTPENIPAATQLFTPNWIVRYMVENSLGRLWMLNRPNSKLVEKMEYYIKPVHEENDFLRVSSPEEIKVCDPACGSGHLLTYSFDLLYSIYEENGCDPVEIPEKILRHNLFGIEIDERAGELAAFALTMKARAKNRRFFGLGIKPNICVLQNLRFEKEELKSYKEAAGREVFSAPVLTLLQQFEEAENFGSLIRPAVTNVASIQKQLESKDFIGQLFLSATHQKVLQVFAQAEYLSQKYHVVIANPPYMGAKGMNARLASWLKENYADAKSDLFSAFMVRNTEIALPKGQLGFMSPFVWMFISSYEKVREFLIGTKTITSLVQLEYSGFDGATVPICTFTIENRHQPALKGGYVRLSDFRGSENQAPRTLEAISNPDCGWFYRASSADFANIPGSPIAFWLSDAILESFAKGEFISNYCVTRKGMATGLNAVFVRSWYEISINRIGFDYSRQEALASGLRWFPYANGGEYRKWYGDFEDVVNWEHDGQRLQTEEHESGRIRAVNLNLEYIFKPGLSWTSITSGAFSIRFLPKGFLFSSASNALFGDGSVDFYLGLLNSKVHSVLGKALNPTLNANPGDIGKIPMPGMAAIDISRNILLITGISRRDWDSFETSWDFPGHPLLSQGQWSTQPNGRLRLPGEPDAENHNSIDLSVQWPALKGATLAESYAAWRTFAEQQTAELKRLEEENNRLFIEAYGLQGELTPEVPLKEITLTVNPVYRFGEGKTQDEYDKLCREAAAKELISYAVGCLFGRYSLDRPGLILANAGETLEDFHAKVPGASFLPDSDNVIPLLEEDWFEDDLYAQFKEWLKVAWGPTTLEQNLSWLEEALSKDLRKYLARDFYKDHVSTYRKRPIYWLFQSPAGSFQALIYLHRYTADTVGVVLNDYVRQFVAKLEGHRKMLLDQSIDPNATQGQKTKALKELDRVRKQLEDLNDYDRDILFPLATQRIALDLDDGVRVNYPKLGAALKRIPGLEAEE